MVWPFSSNCLNETIQIKGYTVGFCWEISKLFFGKDILFISLHLISRLHLYFREPETAEIIVLNLYFRHSQPSNKCNAMLTVEFRIILNRIEQGLLWNDSENTVESRYLELGYLEFCEVRSIFLNQKCILIAFSNTSMAFGTFLQVQITRSEN